MMRRSVPVVTMCSMLGVSPGGYYAWCKLTPSVREQEMAESFFASLQVELLDRFCWPTRASLTSAIFKYIEGIYNRRRRHSACHIMASWMA